MKIQFAKVLTPFAPNYRRTFVESLERPSTAVLQLFAPRLEELRRALDMYSHHLDALKTDHARCLDAIRVAEMQLVTRAYSSETATLADEGVSAVLDRVSAQHYEDAQRAWRGFLQYASESQAFVQVGVFLVDQRELIAKIHRHATARMEKLDDALPGLYRLFLRDLLLEVDGKIDKVTKIPTSFEDANEWLTHVIEMLPSHAFRQRLDAKCANVARLQGLLHERQAAGKTPCASGSARVGDSVHKLEVEWESTLDTLMVCLSRVQDRESEHRRSFYDLSSKTEEYVTTQLDLLRSEFEAIPISFPANRSSSSAAWMPPAPSARDGSFNTKRKEKELGVRRDHIVQKLESLVELDCECKRVQRAFAVYEREFRAIEEHRQSGSTDSFIPPDDHFASAATTVVDAQRLSSEILLEQVVTAVDLRKWFESWMTHVAKWETAPLSSVHPGTVLTRIRQFRRRLLFASSRLFRSAMGGGVRGPVSEGLVPALAFLSKDFELVRVFDESISEMAEACKIFQALAAGSFTDARWQVVDAMLRALPLLHSSLNPRSQLTLRWLREHWRAQHPQQVHEFLNLCDQAIIESRARTKVAQARQRLALLTVRFVEEKYTIRCEGVRDVLVQLEDLLLDIKLCLDEQNPELDAVLSLCGEVESKLYVCERIQVFQDTWLLVCEIAKLHDTDEFFTHASKPASSTKASAVGDGKQEAVAQWAAFKSASGAWGDRLRRAFCSNAKELGERGSSTERTVASADCALGDIVAAFDGFDFDQCTSCCELGAQLLRQYFSAVREMAPRLYALSDSALLQLLVREDDCNQIHQSLSVCFPHVDAFSIGTAARTEDASSSEDDEDERLRENNTLLLSNARATGPIVIRGIECAASPMRVEFNLPVVKIGRVKFWFSRLEEELNALVTTHVRRSVQAMLDDGNSEPVTSVLVEKKLCQALLPQSVELALLLRFRYHVDQSLEHYRTHREALQQSQLALAGQAELRWKVLDELAKQTETSVSDLVMVLKNPSPGLVRADVRVESVLLLCFHQLHVVRHLSDLLRRDEWDNAVLFWNIQLKVGAALEPGVRTMSKAGKSELGAKLLEFQTGQQCAIRPTATRSDNGSGLIGMAFYAQAAHVELAIGHEYVGCARLVAVTPLAERCVYAIFSAMRTHSLALFVAYTPQRHQQEQFSLLTAICQKLMKPSFAIYCGPNVQTLDAIERLMEAAVALSGFFSIFGVLKLPTSLRSACRESLVQASHQFHTRHAYQASASTGMVRGDSAAIFVPIDGESSLRDSGFLSSLLTPFRALTLVSPAVVYFVESLLLLEGFTSDQAGKLGVASFFEGFAVAETELSAAPSVYRLVVSALKEARRLRASFLAVEIDADSGSPSRRASSLHNPRGSVNHRHADVFSVAAEQCVFATAIRNTVFPALAQGGSDALTRRTRLLLSMCLPLDPASRLVADTFRAGTQEDDVAGALAICLERSKFARNDVQFALMMDMWRAMQFNQAIAVYGPPGSGKTTCVKTLHHALCALELARESVDASGAAGKSRDQHGSSSSSQSQLVVLNPSLLSIEELYGDTVGVVATQHPAFASTAGLLGQLFASSCTPSAYSSQTRTWVLVDDGGSGAGSAWFEPLVGLFADSRWLRLLDGTSVRVSPEASSRVRLIFESIDLGNMSPRLLVDCWSVFVPSGSVMHVDILWAWQQSWEQHILFTPGSTASCNLATVFATVNLLVSTICVRFISEELGRVDSYYEPESHPQQGEEQNARIDLRFGQLSMLHMTQTTLRLVTSLVLEHRALLEELSHAQVSLLMSYAVIWGFAGHVSDAMRHKLEQFIRAQGKHFAELKHLMDLPGSIASGDHFASVWDRLQPLQYCPGRIGPGSAAAAVENDPSAGSSKERLVFDPSSAHFVVLAPAATSLVRMCRQLLRFSHSFLFIGPSATGKTTLLRLLKLLNGEDEAAEEMVDASLDARQPHGILDWLQMPSSWFRPGLPTLDVSAARTRCKVEAQLFTPRTAHSTIFLDDIGANVSEESGVGAQEEFVRSVLDHHQAFSHKYARFLPVAKAIGAAMRADEKSATRFSVPLVRLMRHFMVFRVPHYDRRQLLSIFRSKFHAHFQIAGTPDISTAGHGSRSAHVVGEGLLSMEETALRASVELVVELTAVQQPVNKAFGAFVFNLHHVSTLLERTLKFAASLRRQEHGGVAATSLLLLGKLHQAWVSEIRSVLLVNVSAADATNPKQRKPSATATPIADALQSQRLDLPSSIIWSALRLISEKYFSVSLRDDPRTLASVETVYFALQLACKYTQTHVVDQLARLRDVMTSNASASSTLARTWNHPGGSRVASCSNKPGSQSTESTSEAIQRILLLLASSVSWSSSSPPVRNYGPHDMSTLEVRLLTGNAYGLSKTMQLIHALDEQRHLVITARDSRAVTESLLRFACDSLGLQVKRLTRQQNRHELDETLRTILHAAVIQNERTALWIECDSCDLRRPAGNTHALIDFLNELCLNQVPSLVFRSGELRDAALLSFVQSRRTLEMTSESEVLRNFADRVQRNLRVCIFVDSSESHSSPASVDSPWALPQWLTTRERFQWFCFERVENLSETMTEMARVAIGMLTLFAPPPTGGNSVETAAALMTASDTGSENGDTATRAVSTCLEIHALLTESMVVPLSECFQLTYFLSFLKNVVVQHQRRTAQLSTRVEQCQQMLRTLKAKREHASTFAVQRRSLEDRLAQLRRLLLVIAEATEQRRQQERDDTAALRRQLESATQVDIENHKETAASVTAAAARSEYASWSLRAVWEETNLELVTTETELSAIRLCLGDWSVVEGLESEFVSVRESELERLLSDRARTKLLADSLLQSALAAYSYVASLSCTQRSLRVMKLKKLVSSLHHEDVGDLSSLLATTPQDFSSETMGGHGGEGNGRSDAADVRLAKAIWGVQFPFLRSGSALDVIAVADEQCDRLPVFVDQTGLLQRCFIHFFSGHSLYSSPADEKDAASHSAMIVTCEDEKLVAKLQEAQRRDVPVLLLNFRLDRALPQLLPFLESLRGHQRQSFLAQITVYSFEEHIANEAACVSKARIAATAAPVALRSSTMAASTSESKSRQPRKKIGAGLLSTDIAAAAVAAMAILKSDGVGTPQHHQTEKARCTLQTTPPASWSHQHLRSKVPGGFQLFAVSSSPIPIRDQHAVAMHLAVFNVALEPPALELFFRDLWLRKTFVKLHHELRGVECAQLESAHRTEQLERKLSALLVSPVSSLRLKLGSAPWIHAFFQHLELVPRGLENLNNDKHRHRSELFQLRERQEGIMRDANAYTRLANEFVSVASAMSAVSTLAGASSQLYAHSLRWIECTIETQLKTLDSRYGSARHLEFLVDSTELVQSIVTEAVQQLVAAYASASHRHIFLFLLAVEREAQRSGQRTAYKRVVDLLSRSTGGARIRRSSGLHNEATTLASTSSPSPSTQPSKTGLRHAPSHAEGRTLVDRLRRKVRLCTFVFDRLLSPGSSDTRQARNASRANAAVMAMRMPGSGANATLRPVASATRPPATRKTLFQQRAEEILNALLTAVDAVWSDWRLGKARTRLDVKRVLSSLGIQRSRSQRHAILTTVIDAQPQVSTAVALVGQDDLFREYAVEQADKLEESDPTRFEKQMGRLLLTKMYSPDAFADAMDAYIERECALEHRTAITATFALLPPSQPVRELARRLSSYTSAGAALVSDVTSVRPGIRIHLPARLIVYDESKRNRAEILLSSWLHSSSGALTVEHWDAAMMRARLTELVTSKERLVVELLAADDFDRIVALVSQLINQHAMLSPPEWHVIAALPVANRIRSSVMPLIAKSVLARRADSSELPHDVKRWLVDRGVSDTFATTWVARELSDSGRVSSLRAGAANPPLLSDLKVLAMQFKALDDIVATTSAERDQLQRALLELTTSTAMTTTIMPTTAIAAVDAVVPASTTIDSLSSVNSVLLNSSSASVETRKCASRASSSAELLSDLLLLRRSMALATPRVMIVLDESEPTLVQKGVADEDACSPTEIPERVLKLSAQFGSLYHLLREEIAARAFVNPSPQQPTGFFPWSSLADEFDAHFQAFASVTKSFETLQHHARDSDELSIFAQQQITSLTNGLIPFEWMELAFTHTVGPSTSISVPQLVLLVTCRLGMLLNCLCGEPQFAINLAVLSDARAFLRAMMAHCAAEWETPVEELVLVLDVDVTATQADDIPSAAKTHSASHQSDARPSALDAAVVKDGREFPCGFRVDGLVVIEQSITTSKRRQTLLHSLPLCRLYCAVASELEALERTEANAAQEKRSGVDSACKWAEQLESASQTAAAAVKAVSLVMLPSLSPYQCPPSLLQRSECDTDATLAASVRLRFSLPVVVPALGVFRRDQTAVAFAIGAPMFPDDDDQSGG